MTGSAALIRRLCTEFKLSRQAAFELVSHFCGITKAQVLSNPEVDDAAVLDAAKRCAHGEPLQYIIGEWSFFGKKIYCRKGVLIPREDTEVLASKAASLYRGGEIADLCCGSGCVGLAVSLVTGRRVTCIDISPDALELTRLNADLWGVSADTVKRDILNEEISGQFGLITCNPPYIPTAAIRKLDKSVKAFEPHLALDGGGDGLVFYRRLAKIAASPSLIRGGAFACEIGFDQKDAVCKIFAEAGFEPNSLCDSAGLDRVVYFIKK